MSIDVTSTSRFRLTEPIVIDGRETFGLWTRPEGLKRENLNQDDIKTIRITQATAGRPDLIAFQEYGTPLLEWIIIMFNRPRNTLNWPPVGAQIDIPRRGVVLGNVL